MAHSIGSKPLLLKNFNLHEILSYSAKFSSATGNRSVAANISKGLKLFDANFVSKISITEPDFLMNDDFFIQGFVKAEMKKKVTNNPSVQIRTTCQSHTAFRVVEYLAQPNVATLPHPTYSPNLAARLFFVPRNKVDAQGEASRIGRGGSTDRDE
ncbi:hypothetical protein TNCV_3859871 [Trichonephila clavipes]|nr:hypothetical protein TNCV_3859871 [Trichonephila clavipes]